MSRQHFVFLDDGETYSGLAVIPRHVVDEEPHRGEPVQRGVGSVMVVALDEARQGFEALALVAYSRT